MSMRVRNECQAAEKIRCRIFQQRDPDANPYYPKTAIALRCIRALEQIISQSETMPTESPRTGETVGVSGDTICIDRIAGGHRGKIKNDTEIDFHVILRSGVTAETFLQRAEQACRENDVQLLCLTEETTEE